MTGGHPGADETATNATQRRGAVFFDRDGVLNEDFGYIGEIERFVWRPGARAAIKLANDLGLFVFVVTNQAGVARGFFSEESVIALHAFMQQDLVALGAHIDDFRFCPHHTDGTVPRYTKACAWRKPEPGMLLDVLRHWPVDVHHSVMLGDKASDLAAAKGAGIAAIMVDDRPLDALLHAYLSESGIGDVQGVPQSG
jgi:D-glycero-D-manno-heptose 1,7-bisphosphate phosphatase